MIEYHKIDSVYMRDPATKHKTFMLGEWARPEFEALALCKWVWTEKIDGTNIRVSLDECGAIRFGGRTAAAQIPTHLLASLQDRFGDGGALRSFPSGTVLYGEGFGAKIQKVGHLYHATRADFILFDVLLGGRTWAERDNVVGIAAALGCMVVPGAGDGTLFDAIDYAANGFDSVIGECKAEGLVVRPVVELSDRLGRRIITKVKTRDFV